MFFDPEYATTQTDGIEIFACQASLEDSECAYYVRIENNSVETIQVLGKNFCITDDRGNNFYTNETGFQGELPELFPGEYFEFSALAPSSLKMGVLYGSCRVARGKNKIVQNIKIPTVTIENHQQNVLLPNTLGLGLYHFN